MDPEIKKALELLAVGMFTVFTILVFVVITGKSLIVFVNRFFADNNEFNESTRKNISNENINLNGKKIAAIVATVDILTQGKGKVQSIKKIK